MKKIIFALLIFTILFATCACGNDKTPSDDDETKSKSEQGLVPSVSRMETDLTDALEQKNAYAKIADWETEKSLSEKGSYSATVKITAETAYAQWAYTADIAYTKYDQGWMLDSVDWTTGEYTLNSLPAQNQMNDRANAVLNEDLYDVPITGTLVFDDTYTEEYCLENEILILDWEMPVQLFHADYTKYYRSYWRYTPETDSWDLETDGDYKVTCTDGPLNKHAVDLTGNWEKVRITEFSWYNITLSWYDDWDQEWAKPMSFSKLSSAPSGGNNSTTLLWYYGDNGIYLCVQFYEDSTVFLICKNSYGLKILGGQTFAADTQPVEIPEEEPEENFVINGGFEEGFSGWKWVPYSSNDPRNMCSFVSDCYEGEQALRLSHIGLVGIMVEQTISGLEEGAYTLTVCVQGMLSCDIEDIRGTDNWDFYAYAIIEGETFMMELPLNNQWDTVELNDLYVPDEGEITVGFFVYLPTAESYGITIDAISLVKG